MPTLDDTTTLQQNIAVAANDSICISNADSSGSSKIQQVPAAIIAQGFTHAFVVNYDNATIAAGGADTHKHVKLLDVPANSLIAKVRLVITEAFAGLTTCVGSVGRADDGGQYIATFDLTAVYGKENTGSALTTADDSEMTNHTGDTDLKMTFDPSTGGENLANLTAGQVVVLASITEGADYKDLVPATTA